MVVDYYVMLLSVVNFLLSLVLSEEILEVGGMSEYACYGQILDIQCKGNEVIVFDKARYGRNDTQIATACDTHYKVSIQTFLKKSVCRIFNRLIKLFLHLN